LAATDSTRLTASEGRRFALTLCAGFAVLGTIAAWRGRQSLATALLVVAAAALLAALLVPTRLGGAQRGWMRLGLALSRVTTPLFYGVLYLVMIAPMGWIRRTVSKSPLARDPAAGSYWIPREPRSADEQRAALERQF